MDNLSFEKLGFSSAMDSQTLRHSILIFNCINNLSIVDRSIKKKSGIRLKYAVMVKDCTKINMFCAFVDLALRNAFFEILS